MEHFNLNKFINGSLSCNLLSFHLPKENSSINHILYEIFLKAIDYNNKEKFKENVGFITLIGCSLKGLYDKIKTLEPRVEYVDKYESVKSTIYKTQYQQFYLREKFPGSKSIVYIDLDEISNWSEFEEIRTMFINAKHWTMQCFIFCRDASLVFQEFDRHLSTWIFCDEFSEFQDVFLSKEFNSALRQSFDKKTSNNISSEKNTQRVSDFVNREMIFDEKTFMMIKQFQKLHFSILVQFATQHDSERGGKALQRFYFL
jgi:hypothetical protein